MMSVSLRVGLQGNEHKKEKNSCQLTKKNGWGVRIYVCQAAAFIGLTCLYYLWTKNRGEWARTQALYSYSKYLCTGLIVEGSSNEEQHFSSDGGFIPAVALCVILIRIISCMYFDFMC